MLLDLVINSSYCTNVRLNVGTSNDTLLKRHVHTNGLPIHIKIMAGFDEQLSYHLGLDLGTQSAKAVLCSSFSCDHTDTCHIIAVGRSKEIIMNTSDSCDHAEQEPQHWIRAITEACQDLVETFSDQSTHPLEVNRICSVAVSGHQHGLVLLDKNDEVVRPCMMWCDTRAAVEAHEFSEYANAACPAGFTAPKIMWLKRNEPTNYQRTAKIMLPHDFINYYLSGYSVHAMERGDSSGMGIFSLTKDSFDDDLMNFIDSDLSSKLPPIAEPHQPIGSVHEDTFRELFPSYNGKRSIQIAPGCGDNALSTLAVTSLSPQCPSPLILSLGTSGTLAATSPHPLEDPSGTIAPFCDSTGNYLPLVCIQNCSLVPEEVRKTFPLLSIDAITALATQEPAGSEGVLLLPYFSEGGERTPNWPAASGCFLGLKHGHLQRPGLLYRAALESVAYSLLRGHRFMVQHGLGQEGAAPRPISLVGGGAENSLWRQIIADVFQASVQVHDQQVTAHASAVGAALQAAAIARRVRVGDVQLELVGNVQTTICHPTTNQETRRVYAACFQRHVSVSDNLFGLT